MSKRFFPTLHPPRIHEEEADEDSPLVPLTYGSPNAHEVSHVAPPPPPTTKLKETLVAHCPALASGRFYGNLSIAILFVLLSTLQTVTLPIWHACFPETTEGAPYAILFYTSFFLCISSAVFTGIYWYARRKPPTAPIRQFWWIYLVLGGCLCVNGFLLVYSSIPERTPGLLQALLLNSGFMWNFLVSKLHRTQFNYFRWTPIVALVLCIVAIIAGVAPFGHKAIQHADPFLSQKNGVGWLLFYFAAFAPGALANVYFEKFFTQRYASPPPNNSFNHIYDFLTLSLYGNVVQFLLICVSFWVDLLPYFGTTSTDISAFFNNFIESTACLVHLSQCSTPAWGLGLLFFSSFFFQGVLSSFLQPDSLVFIHIFGPFASPLSVILLNVYLKPSQSGSNVSSPAWIAVSTALAFIGSMMWKAWEIEERNRINTAAPPPSQPVETEIQKEEDEEEDKMIN